MCGRCARWRSFWRCSGSRSPPVCSWRVGYAGASSLWRSPPLVPRRPPASSLLQRPSIISTSLVNDRNMIVRAYGVGAIHPAPREVLMIGLATGAWAQVIANMPGVEKFTIVEINPGYLQLIAKYPQVSSLLRNPKVEIVIDDGRRWLARHPDRQFDVIVANVTFHFRAHA